MPYDHILWGESAAKNGLTLTLAKGPTGIGYTISGDSITLKSKPKPYLNAIVVGGTSKPNGGRILPTKNPSSFYCNGGMDMVGNEANYIESYSCPELYKEDVLTGYTSSTNVDEETLMAAVISYGQPLSPIAPQLARFRGAQHFKELLTVTSAAAVTSLSGGSTITSILTNTQNWENPDGIYYLLGISGYISVADGAGILQFYNLPGQWENYVPGVICNPLSGVTFSDDQPFTPFKEPIGPITGEQMRNTVSAGLFASGAVAQTKVLHFCRTR